MSQISEAEAVVTVTPYRADDARALHLTTRTAAAMRPMGDLEALWRGYETAGPAWTLRVDGTVVGCAGLVFLWPAGAPRVAMAWLLASDDLPRYPLTALRALVDQLRALIAQYGLLRIEASAQADHVTGQRFLTWLGFTREVDGVARRYGPQDDDFVRYEWVRPR